MTSIANNLEVVRDIISQACTQAKRETDNVQLLAVSKTRDAAELQQLYCAGQTHFGENYLQEGLDKIDALSELPLTWHFIGPIQSNKTRPIAENFSWVHSVDRLKIAQRLSNQRPIHLPPLNICIQVNISREENKAGCLPEELPELITQISSLAHLKLRGLMAIPKATQDAAEQRLAFSAMQELLLEGQKQSPALDTLSMGMSADIVPAIHCGATIIRVGTALFGPRDYT